MMLTVLSVIRSRNRPRVVVTHPRHTLGGWCPTPNRAIHRGFCSTETPSDSRVRAAAASTAVVGRLRSVSAAKDTSHLGWPQLASPRRPHSAERARGPGRVILLGWRGPVMLRVDPWKGLLEPVTRFSALIGAWSGAPAGWSILIGRDRAADRGAPLAKDGDGADEEFLAFWTPAVNLAEASRAKGLIRNVGAEFRCGACMTCWPKVAFPRRRRCHKWRGRW